MRKRESSGLFEDYIPTFQEKHVHGEALLSLNNEILRDEFHIKSYGKRFELLKAIQKLAKHCRLAALAARARTTAAWRWARARTRTWTTGRTWT